MAKQIRVGILGTGFMGQQHGKRLSAMSDVTVAAICDTRPEGASGLKESLKCDAALYSSFDDMLARGALDALYVCIPPFAHDGQVEKAASKGIHLFLEKPIALSVAQGESMVKAIEKARVVSQVGFHMRFRKSALKLKAMIDAKAAGSPTLFTGRFWCNMLGGSWWHDVKGSGGQAFEQVIHIYDLATHLFGAPVSVSGLMANLCHTGNKAYTVEDTSIGTIRFANGAMATITGSNCALPDHFYGDWRAVFEKVQAEYRTTGDWRDKDESTLWTYGSGSAVREDMVEDGDPYGGEDEDFINAIRTGGATRTPARDGLDAIKLVSAMIESSKRNGAPINL